MSRTHAIVFFDMELKISLAWSKAVSVCDWMRLYLVYAVSVSVGNDERDAILLACDTQMVSITYASIIVYFCL